MSVPLGEQFMRMSAEQNVYVMKRKWIEMNPFGETNRQL
jgi:hypothetical protein